MRGLRQLLARLAQDLASRLAREVAGVAAFEENLGRHAVHASESPLIEDGKPRQYRPHGRNDYLDSILGAEEQSLDSRARAFVDARHPHSGR